MVGTYSRAPLRSGGASYEKKIYPPTWDHQFYIISVDTSNQYITNTVNPLRVNKGTTVEYNLSLPTRLVVTEGETITNIDLTLADQWTNIVGWVVSSGGTQAPLVSGVPVIVSADMTLIPTVRHVVRYTMSFDTTSQYITNTITPFLIDENSTASYQTATSNKMTFVEGGAIFDKALELSADYFGVSGWSANSSPMTAGTSLTITEATQFTPALQIIHKDTQGPCPNGFHIGTKDERQTLISALTTLGAYNVSNIKTYLKIPDAYYLARSNGAKETRYGKVRIWTSTMTANNIAWCWGIDQDNKFVFQEDKPGNAFSIRPFKDNSVAPDNTWTLMYTGIYWNNILGLISIQNGNSWITISDKNLGASNVGDDGVYYQFGNNHGFNVSPTPYVTSKPTLTTDYGPGNYYDNSTYVRVSTGNNWFNGTVNNIWGGVTNGTWTEAV